MHRAEATPAQDDSAVAGSGQRTLAEIEQAQFAASGNSYSQLRAEFLGHLATAPAAADSPAVQEASAIAPAALERALAVLRTAVRTAPADAAALVQDPALPPELRKPARDALVDEVLDQKGTAETARHIRALTENDLMYQAIFRLAERLSEHHAPDAVARLLVEHQLLNENMASQVADAVFSQRSPAR
jgi:crotonobetainyl-CoA:carnitine CoA-transferase CaiB-like acyl-CoA transferase